MTAILAAPGRAHAAGLAALRRAGGRVVPADDAAAGREIDRADVVVDGLVGIGAHPPLRPPMDRLVELADACTGRRIAVDLPSGIDPDTGRVIGSCFVADATVTIGAVKTGLWLGAAAGRIVVASIGMDPARWAPDVGFDAAALTDEDAASMVPEPGAPDNKYSGGVVGIAAGSGRYPGAALLCVGGAVRLRPGLVRYAGPMAAEVVRRWPEAVASADIAGAGRVQAWVVGPGIGTDDAGRDRLRSVLRADVPVLVDADGLTLLASAPALLAERRRRGLPTLLTPHAGEFARLFPDIDPVDRLSAARRAAARCGAVVLLKGHRTVIADPAGGAFVTLAGSPWLATAGSGDVLSGVAGSLLAAGLDTPAAAALAAHLHGRAGERARVRGAAGASALLDTLR